MHSSHLAYARRNRRELKNVCAAHSYFVAGDAAVFAPPRLRVT